jgi:hypothetical protein
MDESRERTPRLFLSVFVLQDIEETQETHGHVSMHWIEWLFARQKSRNSQQRIGM